MWWSPFHMPCGGGWLQSVVVGTRPRGSRGIAATCSRHSLAGWGWPGHMAARRAPAPRNPQCSPVLRHCRAAARASTGAWRLPHASRWCRVCLARFRAPRLHASPARRAVAWRAVCCFHPAASRWRWRWRWRARYCGRWYPRPAVGLGVDRAVPCLARGLPPTTWQACGRSRTGGAVGPRVATGPTAALRCAPRCCCMAGAGADPVAARAQTAQPFHRKWRMGSAKAVRRRPAPRVGAGPAHARTPRTHAVRCRTMPERYVIGSRR